MNIYDIAKKANVSIATISRAITPSEQHKVAPKTLERIQRLITRYGYTPNFAARKLGSTRYRTIGVLIPHVRGLFYSDYYRHTLAGVSDAILQHNLEAQDEYLFKLITVKSGFVQWDMQTVKIQTQATHYWDHYNFRAGQAVDAIAIVHWPMFFSNPKAVNSLGLPTLVISDHHPDITVLQSTDTPHEGGALAAEYLFNKGHRNFAVMEGLSWSVDSVNRAKGFADGLKRRSKSVKISRLRGDFQTHVAREAALKFFRSGSKATAFFCCNDLMAIGVLEAAAALGIKCPKDISVVGYDNDGLCLLNRPRLTTIKMPVYDIAQKGIIALLNQLENPKQAGVETIVSPVNLIERDSAGAVSKS